MTAWRFLFFSIIVHLLIWLILASQPPFEFPKKDNVEVEIVEKGPKGTPKSIVRQALPPLDMLKPEPPINPKFLSEKDQNVKKQMKAKLSGLTQNGNSTFNNKQTQKQTSGGGGSQGSEGDTGGKKGLNDLMPGPDKPIASNNVMTANGEYLPDVGEGPITALNTERFVYYSFFRALKKD